MNSNNSEKEIDVIDLGKGLTTLTYSIASKVVNFSRFIKKNILILIGIIIIGGSAGFGLQEYFAKYNSYVIVSSNFESVDYLYNTVDLLNSKIKQKDKKFLEAIGIKDYQQISKVKVEPIIDVYKFITNNPQNFEMIKLLSENGDAQATLKDLVTSKNYSTHQITLTTNDDAVSSKVIKAILEYLNNNKYHNDLRLTTIRNIDIKIASNQQVILQIDQILKDFSNSTKDSQNKSDKLVYYNDNMQLNDIITTRNNLVGEQGALRLEKESYDKFIKDKSTTLNIKDSTSVFSKLMVLLPAILLGLFFVLHLLIYMSKKVR